MMLNFNINYISLDCYMYLCLGAYSVEQLSAIMGSICK